VILALLLLAACAVPAPILDNPAGADPRPSDPASPPPAAGPEGEKLYQVLYATEMGTAAHASGQRVRILAWLSAMQFDAAQLAGLAELAADVQRRDAAMTFARAELDAREVARLGPIYAALEARLAAPAPMTEEESGAFAARIEAARTELYRGADPRAAHYAGVNALLGAARPWMTSITEVQRDRLAASRFFLGRRIGPFVNPGDYGALVGTMWDGGDFGSLRATVRPTDESHLDIGGLWSIETMKAGPDRHVGGLQAEAILVMALLEPEMLPAIALRQAGEHAELTTTAASATTAPPAPATTP
jgi:hypothetical protein